MRFASGRRVICASVPPPVGDFLIAPLLTEFAEQYPDITFEIVVQSSLDDIVAGRFDAGVHGNRFLAQDMVAVRCPPTVRWSQRLDISRDMERLPLRPTSKSTGASAQGFRMAAWSIGRL